MAKIWGVAKILEVINGGSQEQVELARSKHEHIIASLEELFLDNKYIEPKALEDTLSCIGHELEELREIICNGDFLATLHLMQSTVHTIIIDFQSKLKKLMVEHNIDQEVFAKLVKTAMNSEPILGVLIRKVAADLTKSLRELNSSTVYTLESFYNIDNISQHLRSDLISFANYIETSLQNQTDGKKRVLSKEQVIKTCVDAASAIESFSSKHPYDIRERKILLENLSDAKSKIDEFKKKNTDKALHNFRGYLKHMSGIILHINHMLSNQDELISNLIDGERDFNSEDFVKLAKDCTDMNAYVQPINDALKDIALNLAKAREDFSEKMMAFSFKHVKNLCNRVSALLITSFIRIENAKTERGISLDNPVDKRIDISDTTLNTDALNTALSVRKQNTRLDGVNTNRAGAPFRPITLTHHLSLINRTKTNKQDLGGKNLS